MIKSFPNSQPSLGLPELYIRSSGLWFLLAVSAALIHSHKLAPRFSTTTSLSLSLADGCVLPRKCMEAGELGFGRNSFTSLSIGGSLIFGLVLAIFSNYICLFFSAGEIEFQSVNSVGVVREM